jgi:hypothetical protein
MLALPLFLQLFHLPEVVAVVDLSYLETLVVLVVVVVLQTLL